jgi:hypothetical protein
MWNDKPDGYPIPARNPTGTGMNFYPWVRVQISTRSIIAGGRVIALPDPLPSLVVELDHKIPELYCYKHSSEIKYSTLFRSGIFSIHHFVAIW